MIALLQLAMAVVVTSCMSPTATVVPATAAYRPIHARGTRPKRIATTTEQSCAGINSASVEIVDQPSSRVRVQAGTLYKGILHASESAYFVFNGPYAQPVFIRIKPEYGFQASVSIEDPNHKQVQEMPVWYSSPRSSVQTLTLVPSYGGLHQLQIESFQSGEFSLQLDNSDSLARIYPGDTCEGYVTEQAFRYFALPVDKGDSVILDVFPQAGFNPTMAIYDTHWKLLSSQNNLGSGLPEHKVIQAEYTGFMFLEIGGYNGSQGQFQATHK